MSRIVFVIFSGKTGSGLSDFCCFTTGALASFSFFEHRFRFLLALSASMPAKLKQDWQYNTRIVKIERNYQKSFRSRKFRLLRVWLPRQYSERNLIFSCCSKI